MTHENELNKINEKLNNENIQLKMDNAFLEEENKLLKHKLFGPKSESRKSEKEWQQDSLFNESELAIEKKDQELKDKEAAEAEKTVVKEHTREKSKGRKPLPENLPRIERIIEIAPDNRVCPHDGAELKKIGEEVSEKLDVVPAHMRVEKTIRHKYACPCCNSFVVTAPVERQPFPKGLPTAATGAYVVVSKYADGLPLYRQEKMFERLGVELGRGTMASWMIQASEVIKPLYDLIREVLVSLPVLHADETRLQVLKEPGRAATTLSYMWAIAAPYGSHVRAVYFEYHTGRSGKDAEHLLDGFKGSLVCDGFDGYETFAKRTNVNRCGCMAHARRRFDEAVKASKKGAGVANEMLDLIDRLYDIEREVKDAAPEKKLERRRIDSVPILQTIREKIDEYLPGAPPKSLLGDALRYIKNEWRYLIKYSLDGAVPIDNNRVENAIRPFAVGRRNWLFADTQNGAHASAALYSIIESAKINGLNTFDYVKALLTELPKLDGQNDEAMHALLPWNWKPIVS